MSDQNGSSVPEPTANVTLTTDLSAGQANLEIATAVRGRRGVAHKYVKRIRRRHPAWTPAEVVALLDRQYLTAITAAGAAVTVATIAAEVGLAMIPVVGPAAAGGRAALKEAGKQAAKGVAEQAVMAVLPAGDEQLQFEITAIFALALADIHGMNLDQDQAHALVYGLSNGSVSQEQIATMAGTLAQASGGNAAVAGQAIGSGGSHLGHWANTLADSLPAGAAQSLVKGVQTGVLDDVEGVLSGRTLAVAEYGVGSVVGGVTRFVFGRQVLTATKTAFAEPPQSFPPHLSDEAIAVKDDDPASRALDALESAGSTVGSAVAAGATVVGTNAAAAAGVVARSFRKVDLDGDGIPDEPQALTVAKNAGTAITGAAGKAGNLLSSRFGRKTKDASSE